MINTLIHSSTFLWCVAVNPFNSTYRTSSHALLTKSINNRWDGDTLCGYESKCGYAVWSVLSRSSTLCWLWWLWHPGGWSPALAFSPSFSTGNLVDCQKHHGTYSYNIICVVHNWFNQQYLNKLQFLIKPVPYVWLAKAQAIVDEGLLDILVNLEELNEFWSHMLRDYPTHPAASNPQTALPIKLYGAASPESSMFFRCFLNDGRFFSRNFVILGV